MAAKYRGKTIFGKSHQLTLLILWGVKNFNEIAISHTVAEINAFLRFTQKFKMAAKNGRKMVLGKLASQLWVYLALKNFDEIAPSCTVSKIFILFYFPLKSKMADISCEN